MWHQLSSDVVQLAKLLVDERCGIVKNLYEKAIEPDEPPTYIFNAQCASPIFLNRAWDREVADVHATGCAWTREDALWSTLGEAMERYATHCWPQFEFETSRYCDIRERALRLEDLVFFSEEQYQTEGFRWSRLNTEVELEWYPARSLMKANKILAVPANLIWIDYFTKNRAQNFYPQISTGMACGPHEDHVIHGGLREVIERDAFACHWCTAAPPPEVSLTPELKARLHPDVRALLESPHFDIRVKWVTTEIGIPSIFVLMRSPYHEGTTVGGASHPNAAMAIDKAVTEAVHGWKWLNDLRRDSQPIDDKHDVVDFKSHVRYYIDDRHLENLRHYFTDEQIEIPQRYFEAGPSQQSDIELMLQSLSQQGYEAVYTDITPEDIASMGFVIGKVIVPGLQPLASGFNYEHFDTKRLEKFAKWRGIDLKLNLEPHPFP